VPDELTRQVEARRRIHFQSELREFYGGVGVEFPAGDFIEQTDVSGCGAARLIEVVDVFAEDVEGGAYSAFVETGDDGERLVNRFTRDVPIRDSSDDSLGNKR